MGEDERGLPFPLDFIKIKSDSGSEDIHYSAFYEGIPDEYRRAQEELNETEENRRNGMRKLRNFAENESLTCTDDDLLLVLRVCKFNTKKSEKKLEKFLGVRKLFVEMVADMDEEKVKLIMDDMVCGVLPYRDKYGRTIVFSRPNIHLERYDPDDVDVVVFALLLYVTSHYFPLTSVTGLCYIGDCKTDNFYNFYPIFNQFRKSYLNFGLSAPFRISRIDIVNENVLVRLFANVVRPLLPVKISKRLFFNGKGYDNLTKVYHPDIMPEDFGGNLGLLNDKFFRERLLNYMLKLKAECKNT